MVTEPILLPTASVGEMSVVSLTLPILTTVGLKIIISPTSLTLVGPVLPKRVTSPTFIMAGVLVLMRLPLDHR